MNEYHGVKAIVFVNDKMVMLLRDNIPTITYPNMWDLPGGGVEGDESPFEALMREVREECNLEINESHILWQKEYQSIMKPEKKSMFYVLTISPEEFETAELGDEGQEMRLMTPREYLEKENGIDFIKDRIRDYIESTKAD